MIIKGNKKILESKLALVLNSSQSKTPCGRDPWVGATQKAVKHLISENYTIISSLGLLTWELPIYLVSELNGNHVIISPVFDEENGGRVFRNTLWEFDLNENNTVMVFLDNNTKSKSVKANWPTRDRAALALAQAVAPVCIRPGGRLEKLLDSTELVIENSFRVDYTAAKSKPAHYDKTNVNSIIPDWNHVVHWTRTRLGPWPGERKIEYFKRLLSSQDKYPGDAFKTLLNIIREKKIRASSDKIKENAAVVGFSEATPQQIINMMRWCPRQVNWNFEPYGIAIDKEYAIGQGIGPVIYGEDSEYKTLPESLRPFFHSRGHETVDWRGEQEWRHLGDLDISQIPQDKISYFVWDKHEAEIVKAITSGTVHAFRENN
jgi:hypothetical protein